jgi:cellulose synthase/poly-beta-1,6-N-acetylglucosamine synthase-like glycosyltransferase
MTLAEGVFLATYFVVLLVLSIYGSHRYVMAYLYYKYKGNLPTPMARFQELPRVTIQLPVFNEMYVVERLIEAVCAIEYPRDRLEIQVLDDSTDETQGIARALIQQKRRAGTDIS